MVCQVAYSEARVLPNLRASGGWIGGRKGGGGGPVELDS